MRAPIFNDYDENGYRISVTGNRTSRVEDEAIVYNLRFRWREELSSFSDVALCNAYDEFALSDSFSNNDEEFLAFLKEWDAE